MSKKILSILILVLTLSFTTEAFASLTFTTDAIIGTTASSIDLGAGNALSLQTTGNGAINLGTGMVTLGGSITIPMTTNLTTGVIYKGATPFIHNFALAGTDSNNLFIGENAGNFTMTGSIGTQGSKNIGIGTSVLSLNTTGSSNTAIGLYSMQSNTSGLDNNALGRSALSSNTTGISNTGLGSISLFTLTTGNANTGTGYASLFAASTSSFNSGFGIRALGLTTTGGNNTATGAYAGYKSGATPATANAVITGSNLTFVGYQAGLGSATQRTNSTAIGNEAYVDADNTVVLGDENVVDVFAGSAKQAKVSAKGIQLTTGAKPACDVTTRGTQWYVAGGAGVADTMEVCRKDAADAYAWVAVY